jgi:CheY-like chemotaxis protein
VKSSPTDDLLDVSRMITGKISLDVQQVDVAEIVAAAVESVRPAIDAKQIHLDVIADPQLPPTLADPGRLQQVLWNLLSNAVKFTPEQGEIRVSAMSSGSDVTVQVADSGSGIAPTFLPHVFDRFRQSDSSSTRAYGGQGPGPRHPPAARRTARRQGERVQRRRGPGGHLHGHAARAGGLPPSPAPAERAAGDRAAARRRGGDVPDLRGICVLVVDDDAETRDLLEAVLAGAGAEVTTAASGAEALTQIARHVPDVLMSDIAMPHVDGYELIRRVREQHLSLPSIALTAYGSVEDRDRAVAAGFERHVAKPVLPRGLLSVVAGTAHRGHGA